MKKINQYATISGLAAGNYDGVFVWKDILPTNNFGLGTFDQLDGEMIGFDNNFYKIRSDGSVSPVNLDETTPFASLTKFENPSVLEIKNGATKNDLQDVLKTVVNQNHFYALKIVGTFNAIKTRTVSKQVKPYPKLIVASESQAVLEKNDQIGTMVGYLTPNLFNTVGVEGLHLHFLNETKNFGGHVLEFNVGTVSLEIMELEGMDLVFDPTKDPIISNQDEIHQAEK